MRNRQIFLLMSVMSCAHEDRIRSATPFTESVLHPAQYEAHGTGLAVATQGVYATRAAFEIINHGGNIIDAAVAISFVQAVERPHSTGLGGGGFLLWGRAIPNADAQIEAWDFRERAPRAADARMFIDPKSNRADPRLSQRGRLASGVPGLVAGLFDLHQKNGKLPWKKLLEPAIRLATDGFEVYPELAAALEDSAEALAKNDAARAIFFHEGHPLKLHDRLRQIDLANTLRIVANEGKNAFYTGSIAKKILAEAKLSRLLFTKSDLANYRVIRRQVITSSFRDAQVYSMPPPSSGGVHLLEILNVVENDPIEKWGPLDPRTVHLVSSAMQQAFVDRAKFLGDPDFVKVPISDLISKAYAKSVREKIPIGRARKAAEVQPALVNLPHEPNHTIHFSVMDSRGNAVSSTQTINGHFGSAIVVRGTGIVLNNEMDDFSAAVGEKNMFGATSLSAANFIAPAKTPLSSMTPTLVERDGKIVMALGTPNGTRILTCVAQTLLNRIAFRMTPAESVSQIRYHHQWQPDFIQVDEPGLPIETERSLTNWGHVVRTENVGCRVQFIERDLVTGALTAVSDPRAEGSARVESFSE